MGMLAVDLSGLNASDFTGFDVIAGLSLAVLAVCFWAPAVLAGQRTRQATRPFSRMAYGVGTLVLTIMAAAPTFGAGWFLWTAHRGEWRPYYSDCRTEARQHGYHGAAASEYVAGCIRQRLADS